MTIVRQIMRGSTAQADAVTSVVGHLIMDTTRKDLRLFDGTALGGHVINSRATLATDTAVNVYNSQRLNSQNAAFYQNAANLNAGTLPAARLAGNYSFAQLTLSSALVLTNAAATVVTNLDSDKLDGQHGSFYQNAANLNAGTLPAARLSGNYAFAQLTLSGSLIAKDGKVGSGGSTVAGTDLFIFDTERPWQIRQRNVGANAALSFENSTGKFIELSNFDRTVTPAAGIVINPTSVNAYISVNGNFVWHSGNMGAGSGLNADLLDGQHGAFYQSAANLNAGTLPNARLVGDYSFANLTLSATMQSLNAVATNATTPTVSSTAHAIQGGQSNGLNVRMGRDRIVFANNGATSQGRIEGSTITLAGETAVTGNLAVAGLNIIFGALSGTTLMQWDVATKTLICFDPAGFGIQAGNYDTGNVRLNSTELRTDLGAWAMGNSGGFRIINSGLLQMARSGGANIQLNRYTTDGQIMTFSASNTQVGSVTVSGSATSFDTTSDERKKHDLRPIDLSIVDRLELWDFEWIAEPGVRGHGVMAQKAYGLIPMFVNHNEDEWEDADGEIHKNDIWSADYSKGVPLALALGKDHRSRIAALENRIAALEALAA